MSNGDRLCVKVLPDRGSTRYYCGKPATFFCEGRPPGFMPLCEEHAHKDKYCCKTEVPS